MPRAPSVALDRTGRPSHDSDPPAPGCLFAGPATRYGACRRRALSRGGKRVRGEGGRPRRGLLSRRGDAGLRFWWPGSARAGPHQLSPGRAGGNIESGARQLVNLAVEPSVCVSCFGMKLIAGFCPFGYGYIPSHMAPAFDGFLVTSESDS